MKRPSKELYYMKIASIVLERGTCLRRNYGAVIVNQDQIIATGYTGSPRGEENCCDTGKCLREKLNIPSGERYELCHSVHAEMNAVIAAGREKTIGGTIYVIGKDMKTGEFVSTDPCNMCRRVLINAGINFVIIPDLEQFNRALKNGGQVCQRSTFLD